MSDTPLSRLRSDLQGIPPGSAVTVLADDLRAVLGDSATLAAMPDELRRVEQAVAAHDIRSAGAMLAELRAALSPADETR